MTHTTTKNVLLLILKRTLLATLALFVVASAAFGFWAYGKVHPKCRNLPLQNGWLANCYELNGYAEWCGCQMFYLREHYTCDVAFTPEKVFGPELAEACPRSAG